VATFRHGKNSYTNLDNGAGTPVDLSQYFNDVAFPKSIDMGETTSFGNQDKTYIVGVRDNKITLKGTFDATVDAHMDGLISALQAGTLASATIVYGPAGSTSTFPSYTAECLVSDYEIDGSVSAVVTITVGLQITGAVTRSTF